MNKKIISSLMVIVVIACIIFGSTRINRNKKENNSLNNINETKNNIENNKNNSDNLNINGKKVLVVYYSAQNHTKNVSESIAKNLNADVFEIVPKNIYTKDDLDWNNKNSRVSKEHDDESLRKIELVSMKVPNWDSYDIILIGYPIWWGIAAWPTNSFVENNDFSNKIVIPFCTSLSSGIGESDKLLAKLAGTGNWKDGKRFSSSVSDSEIKKWTDSLK
ncbi:flavodoxin [uncultured Parvimonas sp.]|uniref:flavodoxin n=1 Tax=uncultured Parvimonas sp. TaxID=747372 RepID=UPI0028D52A65|nr:flavodoxin [uncultured Parvimonas sp.]